MAALKVALGATSLALGVLAGGCYYPTAMPVADRAVRIAMPLLEERPVPAGSPAEPTWTRLTVDDAIARALERDPDLAELRARVAVAVARSEEADDLEDPELRLTQFRLHDDFDDRANVTLRARPPSPGVLRARVHAAEARAAQARARLERGQQLVAARVAGMFDDCLLLERAVALAERAVEIDNQRSLLADRERTQGVVTRMDSAAATVAAETTAYGVGVWRARLADARASLLETVGLAGAATVELAGEPPAPQAATNAGPTEREMVERALRTRPEVGGAGSGIDAAKAEAWIAGTRSWPQLSFLQVGYELESGSDGSAWTVGMAVDLPLFGFHRDTVHRAEADAHLADSAFASTVYEIAAEVRASLRRLEVAAAAVQSFRAGPLHAAAAARDAARTARAAGTASERDVLDAEGRLIEAHQKVIELLRSFSRARVDLRAAVGAPDDV